MTNKQKKKTGASRNTALNDGNSPEPETETKTDDHHQQIANESDAEIATLCWETGGLQETGPIGNGVVEVGQTAEIRAGVECCYQTLTSAQAFRRVHCCSSSINRSLFSSFFIISSDTFSLLL
jgi:hypothetical protein